LTVDQGYITSRSFLRRARGLVESSRESGRAIFAPGATALLAIDVQRYFTDPTSHACVPGAAGILARIGRLADAFSAGGLPIFFTRHTNADENAGLLARWWDDLILDGSLLADLSEVIDTSRGAVVPKTQYDAFHGTELGEILREREITRLVIVGFVTHLCCETTARSAFVRGFDVTFPVDATATYDEEHHLATLLNLGHGFATLAFVEDLLEAMTEAGR
jgi:bifunctional isochorismate lyase/aryl carrier protein